MSKPADQSKFALAMTVGTMLVANIAGGLVVGYFLDRWLNTAPWLLIIGTVLGTVGAFTSLYRIMSRLN